MNRSPANWFNCSMYMQDLFRENINMAAEVSIIHITNFKNLCSAFSFYLYNNVVDPINFILPIEYKHASNEIPKEKCNDNSGEKSSVAQQKRNEKLNEKPNEKLQGKSNEQLKEKTNKKLNQVSNEKLKENVNQKSNEKLNEKAKQNLNEKLQGKVNKKPNEQLKERPNKKPNQVSSENSKEKVIQKSNEKLNEKLNEKQNKTMSAALSEKPSVPKISSASNQCENRVNPNLSNLNVLSNSIKPFEIVELFSLEFITLNRSVASDRITKLRIFHTVWEFVKTFDDSMTIVPFGSTKYHLGGLETNFDLLILTSK